MSDERTRATNRIADAIFAAAQALENISTSIDRCGVTEVGDAVESIATSLTDGLYAIAKEVREQA